MSLFGNMYVSYTGLYTDTIGLQVVSNNISNLNISQGGKESIQGLKVDIILANINRNILLDQMEEYSKTKNQYH